MYVATWITESKLGTISGLLPPLSSGLLRLLTTFSANLEEVSIIANPESFNCAENQQRAVQLQSFCDVTKGGAERMTTPQDRGLHTKSHYHLRAWSNIIWSAPVFLFSDYFRVRKNLSKK